MKVIIFFKHNVIIDYTYCILLLQQCATIIFNTFAFIIKSFYVYVNKG